MDSLYLLIPITLLLLVVAIWGFFWAVNHDQFDDLDSPATRILFDDDEKATIHEIQQQMKAKSARTIQQSNQQSNQQAKQQEKSK